MRAFITGIAGFAGLHLAEHLLTCGDEVQGASLSGVWPAGDVVPEVVRREVSLTSWDISQPASDQLQARLASFAPDAIYHLAAIAKAEDCGRDEPTELATAININGTRHVLELAAALRGSPRVLLVSSSYVYGAATTANCVASEAQTPAPVGGYAKSKLAAEELARKHVATGGHAVIARAFQHAGPRQEPRFMLAEWCAQFADASGAPIKVRSWNSYIDLCDVRDVVRAYRLLIEHGRRGEAYNVGSGRGCTSGEIFTQLRQLCDPQRAYEADENAPPRYTPVADITKTTAATNWRPEIALERTMRDTYQGSSMTRR